MKNYFSAQKRTRKVTIRFRDTEYDRLFTDFQRSTHREFSGFLRQCLLQRKFTVYTRNQSLDGLVEELGRLRWQLEMVANHLVQKQSIKDGCNHPVWVNSWGQTDAQLLTQAIDQIHSKINQIADVWWQESTAPKA